MWLDQTFDGPSDSVTLFINLYAAKINYNPGIEKKGISEQSFYQRISLSGGMWLSKTDLVLLYKVKVLSTSTLLHLRDRSCTFFASLHSSCSFSY